ncbi:MAG: methyltransferase domain-containing protein [Brevundimonas sp.]|uniref:methyltransferase domain-containing protein n=1 Tax=Brevundimonas sp. TaxID=1871086 RepID=UPI003919948A
MPASPRPLEGTLRPALNRVYDGASIAIEPFQQFPVVIDRLAQLKSALDLSPPAGLALEFGVFKGVSLRALALAFPGRRFTGFDSFEGLPEAWRRSETSTYEAGHFALKALPAMPPNVELVAGFFEDTLDAWLEANPGPVGFVHVDPDLYSAAKVVLDRLTDRLADGAVLVFDELADWKDEGVYPLWREGEWRALCEWLDEQGFCFRILSRSPRFEAAIQVYRKPPPGRRAADDLAHAASLWARGERTTAISLLEEATTAKPDWLTGLHRLAQWRTRARHGEAALAVIEQARAAAGGKATGAVIDLDRLSAENRYRLGDLEQAATDIARFRRRRPDHVSGLTLNALIAARCGRHEESSALWTRAAQISGSAAYDENAREQNTLSEIRPEFRAMRKSGLMIQHLVDDRVFETVLDIGSGAGEQAEALRRHGKRVTELDYGESPSFLSRDDGGAVIIGDFLQTRFETPFDCAIASHVLEHQMNVNAFLKALHASVREDGIVAISVPPLKHQIVGGHLTLWNAGLVLYNLVLAGFDCRTPWIRQYGYNISVVIQKRTISPVGLVFDKGDIDRIAPWLPEGFREGFNGDIRRLG